MLTTFAAESSIRPAFAGQTQASEHGPSRPVPSAMANISSAMRVRTASRPPIVTGLCRARGSDRLVRTGQSPRQTFDDVIEDAARPCVVAFVVPCGPRPPSYATRCGPRSCGRRARAASFVPALIEPTKIPLEFGAFQATISRPGTATRRTGDSSGFVLSITALIQSEPWGALEGPPAQIRRQRSTLSTQSTAESPGPPHVKRRRPQPAPGRRRQAIVATLSERLRARGR